MRTAKQLWTDKQKRVCLLLLQKVRCVSVRFMSLRHHACPFDCVATQFANEALAVLVTHDGSAAVASLQSCLREAIAASDMTLLSKPVQVERLHRPHAMPVHCEK